MKAIHIFSAAIQSFEDFRLSEFMNMARTIAGTATNTPVAEVVPFNPIVRSAEEN